MSCRRRCRDPRLPRRPRCGSGPGPRRDPGRGAWPGTSGRTGPLPPGKPGARTPSGRTSSGDRRCRRRRPRPHRVRTSWGVPNQRSRRDRLRVPPTGRKTANAVPPGPCPPGGTASAWRRAARELPPTGRGGNAGWSGTAGPDGRRRPRDPWAGGRRRSTRRGPFRRPQPTGCRWS